MVNGTYELVRERNGPFAGKKINRPVAKYDYCHRYYIHILRKHEYKGGFQSEDTGEFLILQNKYSKSLSWAESFYVLGGKFKFSAQDRDLEYFFLQK